MIPQTVEQYAADLALELARSVSLEQAAHCATHNALNATELVRAYLAAEVGRLRRMLVWSLVAGSACALGALWGWVR